MPEISSSINIQKIIESTFTNVFNSLQSSASIWFRKNQITKVNGGKYSEYLVKNFGSFQLFGVSRRVQITSSYVNLHLTTNIEREKYRSRQKIERALVRAKNQLNRTEKIQKGSRNVLGALDMNDGDLMIIGNAGSGKTTCLRFLTMEIAMGRKIRGENKIPIFLHLRDFGNSQTIFDSAIQQFDLFQFKDCRDVLNILFKNGKCIVILDGFDEVNGDIQRNLLREIKSLKIKFPNLTICISSRPYSTQFALPTFNKWETLPLTFRGKINFIGNWFKEVDPKKGSRLIKLSEKTPEILELGSNPLLLSIICALYYNELNIPRKKHVLLSRAIIGLLGGWDSFRLIARGSNIGNLSLETRGKLVRALALHLFSKGKIVFSTEDIDDVFWKNIEISTGLNEVSKTELLMTLYNDFGILIERAPSVYSFSHLTIQEYLTASNSSLNEAQIIELVPDESWREVILMYVALNPGQYRLLKTLHKKLNFFDKDSGKFLVNVWKANGAPTKDHEKNLIKSLFKKINVHVKKHYSGNLELINGKLIINSVKANSQNFKKDRSSGSTSQTLRRGSSGIRLDKDVKVNERDDFKDKPSPMGLEIIPRILELDRYTDGISILVSENYEQLSPFLTRIKESKYDRISIKR